MKTFNEQQLETHVPIVGILLIVSNAFYLLSAIIVFGVIVIAGGIVGTIGVSSGDPEAARILPQISGLVVLFGAGIAMFLGVLSLPGIIAGVGLLMRKSWARILGIVVAALSLLHFPIGTLIGAYAIIVLAQDAAPQYFETPKPKMETQLQPV
jgi:hypothetical protein